MKKFLFLLAATSVVALAQAGRDSVARDSNRDEKPRVYVTDSDSWEASGGFASGGSRGVGAAVGSSSGGARPQTAEIMKTFGERCPAVTVTINRDKADYIVILQHEGGKEVFQRDNKLALFNKDGDMILSDSTRTMGNAVKSACERIRALR